MEQEHRPAGFPESLVIRAESTAQDLRDFIAATLYYKSKNTFALRRPVFRNVLSMAIYALCGLVFALLIPGARGGLGAVCRIGLGAACTGVAVSGFLLLYMRILFRQLRASVGNSATVTVNSGGVEHRSDDGEQLSSYGWSQVSRVVVTPTLFLFWMRNNLVVFFGRRWVAGREEQLQQWLGQSFRGAFFDRSQ